LINNRQGGRRRGRGGQRGQNLGGQPGNRQDNRQRGNAAQLLEKYKSMARDAQLSGDRVQTEYYLQFADHYFRVLSESRARFEDQNQQNRRQRDEDFDDEDGDEELVEAGEGEASESEERQDRRERQDRGPRRQRGDREPRRFNREERGANEDDEQSEERPHLNGAVDSLPLDVLPPAIGAEEAASDEEAAPRPRRRTRTPRRPEGDEEVAPAA
jgi:rubrerythrin